MWHIHVLHQTINTHLTLETMNPLITTLESSLMSEYDIPVHVFQDSGKSHHKTLKVKKTLTKIQQIE